MEKKKKRKEKGIDSSSNSAGAIFFPFYFTLLLLLLIFFLGIVGVMCAERMLQTDTASVLMEAIGYIKFLQNQVQVSLFPLNRWIALLILLLQLSFHALELCRASGNCSILR